MTGGKAAFTSNSTGTPAQARSLIPILMGHFSFLTKRKNKSLSPGIQEFNLKRPVFHVTLLPDELVETGLANCTHPVRIGIGSAIVAWRGAIQFHLEADGPTILRCT